MHHFFLNYVIINLSDLKELKVKQKTKLDLPRDGT